MHQRASIVLTIIVSMAIAGFASQVLPLSTLSKALTVGLIGAATFVLIVSATRPKRTA
jgi:hypothetical protein